jgi:hypothetical protein
MKKFLKWSAAFLVLGVLAVGCIKNEPSPGIEAMRNAKASLLNAQAALTQAKVQVEAANAALIQAQASLLQAEEAVIAATAARIQAEADLIQAEVEWQNALTDFHKEAWAKEIEALEIELEVLRAEADAAIAQYELEIAQIQDDLVEAMQAYEQALLDFEEWKLDNAAVLGEALMAALDNITEQIKEVLRQMGEAQVDLNFAKAEYEWYVNVTYPQAVEGAMLRLEHDKTRLVCQIEHATRMVEYYQLLYDTYHGEFDALIEEFQEWIVYYRALIAEYELAYIEAQAAFLEYDDTPLINALAALTADRTVGVTGVFSDGGDDPNIHVVNGNYVISYPWQGTPDMFDIMDRDMRVIEDTRSEFEDQESGIIEANIAAKKKTADDAVAAYTANWNKWQTYYDEARITGSHVGSRYIAWQTAWNNWNTAMVAYNAHLDVYCDMYTRAGDLIDLFMDYLDGWLDEGTLVVPGSENLSEVLGGIEFNAGTLANFIFQGNAATVINTLNTLIGLINAPAEMEAIITELKAIMDGTHPEGWPAFWDHATAWTYYPTPVPYGDIMRDVYANSNKEITELANEDWYVWLFLYWLFEDKQVELGLEDPFGGPVITINAADYDDAGLQVLEDFFGDLNCTEYDDYMVGPSTSAIVTAINAYYDAVEGLGNMEYAMFRPFDRLWKAKKYTFDSTGNITGDIDWSRDDALALANVTEKPAIKLIYPTPDTYTPPTYDDDLPMDETQPDPVDEYNFFFVLEAYQDETGPIPSLDFDITYLDAVCDLYVSHAALIAAGEDCGKQWSDWVGDMRLWKWDEKEGFGTGHYFGAIWMTRDYQAYQDTYNRVLNGEYAALIDKIQELYDAQWALYGEAQALATELQAEEDALTDAIAQYPLYIELFEDYVGEYMYLVHQANWAHNGGNEAEEGLLQALTMHKHKLMEKQHQLAAIEEAMAIFEQGLGLRTYYGFIDDMTAIYQAEIDRVLEDIANLQQQLIILEGIRADLLEDFQ